MGTGVVGDQCGGGGKDEGCVVGRQECMDT